MTFAATLVLPFENVDKPLNPPPVKMKSNINEGIYPVMIPALFQKSAFPPYLSSACCFSWIAPIIISWDSRSPSVALSSLSLSAFIMVMASAISPIPKSHVRTSPIVRPKPRQKPTSTPFSRSFCSSRFLMSSSVSLMATLNALFSLSDCWRGV